MSYLYSRSTKQKYKIKESNLCRSLTGSIWFFFVYQTKKTIKQKINKKNEKS